MADFPLCPSCKGPLLEIQAATTPRCLACGAEIRVPAQRGRPPRRAAVMGFVALALALLSLVSVGIVWWSMLPVRIQPLPPPRPSVASPPPPLPTLHAWSGVMPVVGPFFEDGREAMVGVWENGGAQEVVAIDDSFRVRWSSPVSKDEPSRRAEVAVVGQRVAWTRRTHRIRVLDLASGTLVRTVQVPEDTVALCPDPARGGKLLAVGAEGTRSSIDLDTGTVENAAGTLRCPDPSAPRARALTAEAPLPKPAPGHELGPIRWAEVPGALAVADGSIGVAYVVKRPGFPMDDLLGFDVADGKVRWSEPLQHGQVVALDMRDPAVALLHEVSGESRVVELDMRTGRPGWETRLPCRAASLRVEYSRILVLAGRALIVLDRSSGRIAHTVGICP